MKKAKKESTTELTEQLQRLQAEFENFKKRVEKQQVEFVRFANAGLIQKLLPVLDDLEASQKHADNTEEVKKAIPMFHAKLLSILKAEGLTTLDALGKHFDAHLHEAMMTEHSEKNEGLIIEELQKGYMLNEKVLRHSKVKVNVKKDDKQKHEKRGSPENS